MAIDQKVGSVYKIDDVGVGDEKDIRDFFATQREFLGKTNIDDRDSEEEDKARYLAEQKSALSKPVYRSFSVVPADTYAKGVAKLKAKGQVPFSHEQNVEAMVLDYEAKGNKSKLFGTFLDSVTGVAYDAGSSWFKVNPVCYELKVIEPSFNDGFLPVNYKSLKSKDGWVEFDSSDKKVKYNQDLTREEAKVHPAHIAAMGGNSKLWEKCVDLWFDMTGAEKGVGFYVRRNTSEDELRSVVLSDDDYDFDVLGNCDLSYDARFVSSAQSK